MWHENCLNHLNWKIRSDAEDREHFIKVLFRDIDWCLECLEYDMDNCRRVSLAQFEKIYKEAGNNIELCVDGYFLKFAIVDDTPYFKDGEWKFPHLGIIYIAPDSVIKKEA